MRRFISSIAIAIAATLLAAAACSTPAVPVGVAFVLEGAAPERFTTSSGWEVELTEAWVSFSAIYAYAPREVAARTLFAPSRALAHGGFDSLEGRRVQAELLQTHTIDALGDPVELGAVTGLAGVVDSVTVLLNAPADNGPSDGYPIFIAGVARRDGVEVAFEGGLAIDDEMQRRVSGVRVDPALSLEEGARVVIGTDPSAWLAEADFSALQGTELAEDSQPVRALFLGTRSAASWTARIEGGAP